MKTIRINVSKIDKTALYDGKNGKYLDLVMFENKNGEDQYGNLGFVTQDIGKDRRLAGEKGPIIGNFKEIQSRASNAELNNSAPINQDGDDIPF
jgi:hypothetical protein